MYILGLSDEVMLAIIAAIVTIATGVTTALTAWLNTRSVRPVRQVLEQQNVTSAERKADTDQKLQEVTKQVEQVKEGLTQENLVSRVANEVVKKIETNVPLPPSMQ